MLRARHDRRHRKRHGQVAAQRAGPAVRRPLDRLQDHLPPQRLEAPLVAVIKRPPAAVRTLDQRAVPARPPRLRRVGAADQRVVRVVGPGPEHRPRAGHGDHVAGRGAGRPADRGDEVEPVAAPEQLGPFQGVRLDDPVVRVAPAVVRVLDLAVGGQPVVGESDPRHRVQEQVSAAVLAHHVPGVDVAPDAEVDRLGPRPGDVVGVRYIDAGRFQRRPRCRHERDVEVVAAVHLGQVGREHAPDRVLDGRADRRPVDEVARVPDHQAGRVVERAEGEVVVVAVLQHGGVGEVTGQDGVDVRAVALVGAALPFEGGAHRCPRLSWPVRTARARAGGTWRAGGAPARCRGMAAAGPRTRCSGSRCTPAA